MVVGPGGCGSRVQGLWVEGRRSRAVGRGGRRGYGGDPVIPTE